MAVFHDEVEIEDFQDDEDSEAYFYPCPCSDNFSITKEGLENGEDVATCPGCSLILKVIHDKDQFMCGETVLAPQPTKNWLDAEEASSPDPKELGTSQSGNNLCQVTSFFVGTAALWFTVP
jgi:diphthamide biosynthesis protein 3